MAQVSLYMNDSIMDSLRVRSEKEGVSLSKYVGRILESFEKGQSDGWPLGYWDSVYGCLSDEDATVFLKASTPQNESALDPALDDCCDWMVG